MIKLPTVFKKDRKFVYLDDNKGNHHIIKHHVRIYWKLRKTLPDRCILYNSLEELKETLRIA